MKILVASIVAGFIEVGTKLGFRMDGWNKNIEAIIEEMGVSRVNKWTFYRLIFVVFRIGVRGDVTNLCSLLGVFFLDLQ